MLDTTRTALTAAAIARATKLCDAALATLAAGKKTFVKGKPVMVPWSKEKRAELRRLQEGGFDAGDLAAQIAIVEALRPHCGAEGVRDEATEEALMSEATAVYCAAGMAEIDRRFAA